MKVSINGTIYETKGYAVEIPADTKWDTAEVVFVDADNITGYVVRIGGTNSFAVVPGTRPTHEKQAGDRACIRRAISMGYVEAAR